MPPELGQSSDTSESEDPRMPVRNMLMKHIMSRRSSGVSTVPWSSNHSEQILLPLMRLNARSQIQQKATTRWTCGVTNKNTSSGFDSMREASLSGQNTVFSHCGDEKDSCTDGHTERLHLNTCNHNLPFGEEENSRGRGSEATYGLIEISSTKRMDDRGSASGCHEQQCGHWGP